MNLRTGFGGRRVLVTGASGFIGCHLIDRLLADGADVRRMDRVPPAAPPAFETMIGELQDREFIDTIVERTRPEYVFHLAAVKDRASEISDFQRAVEINLLGTLHLLSAAATVASLRSVIVVGTAEEYGRNPCPFRESMREMPVSSYSFSKLCVTQMCEVLARLHGLPVTVVRPTLAYGPGQGQGMFLPDLIMCLLKGEPFGMTAGEQTRDYVYVTDLVDACVRAAAATGQAGRVYNIGSGVQVKVAELAEAVAALVGGEGGIRLGVKPYRPGEIMAYAVDNTRAREELGWSPQVALNEGLRRTVEYYRGLSAR